MFISPTIKSIKDYVITKKIQKESVYPNKILKNHSIFHLPWWCLAMQTVSVLHALPLKLLPPANHNGEEWDFIKTALKKAPKVTYETKQQ